MNDSENQKDNGNGTPQKRRHRSPGYPAVGLRDAIQRSDKIYKADGRAGSPRAAALEHMGFSKAHGQALTVLSALKKFGLVEEKDGSIALTPRAIDILVRPEGDERRCQAIKTAALGPDIYRQLIEAHPSGLPSDTSLKAELIADRDFNPNVVDGFLKDFRDTLDFAGLADSTVLESLIEEHEPSTDEVGGAGREDDSMPPTDIEGKSAGTSFAAGKLRTAKEALSQRVSPDCVAHVAFDGPVTQRAIEKLIAHLDLTKDDYPRNGGGE